MRTPRRALSPRGCSSQDTETKRQGGAYTLALAGRPAAARRALGDYRTALRAGLVGPEPSSEKLASGTIALAEGRYAEAASELQRAPALPTPWLLMSRGCRACGVLMLAKSYGAAGRRDSAIAVYERFVGQPEVDRFWTLAALAPVEERLSELYAAREDARRAALHGAAFLRLWEHADPRLQRRVAPMRRQIELSLTDRPLR